LKSFACVGLLLMLLLLASPACLAASPESNSLAAVALYIDTSGHYIPGIDMLNKALNEVIRFKINALFLGSEVQSGNEVLRDLDRCGIATAADASPESLSAYGDARHVNYILLLSVHPLDISMDLKAYSTVDHSYIIDKTLTRPDGTEALSTLDALSNLVGGGLTDVLQTIRTSLAGTPEPAAG